MAQKKFTREEFVDFYATNIRTFYPTLSEEQVQRLLAEVVPVPCDGKCWYDDCHGWVMIKKVTRLDEASHLKTT